MENIQIAEFVSPQSMVDSDSWQFEFMVMVLAIVVVINCATAIYQVGLTVLQIVLVCCVFMGLPPI